VPALFVRSGVLGMKYSNSAQDRNGSKIFVGCSVRFCGHKVTDEPCMSTKVVSIYRGGMNGTLLETYHPANPDYPTYFTVRARDTELF
jgi:hypothetical protein